jgi:GH15 family glucan-1,4-alpha-glucosidase
MHPLEMPKDRQLSGLLPNQDPQNATESVCVPWPQIEDYGIIGDCRSAALVSRQGSIDWLCWPRFDKPAIFAALLDRDRGGHWRISPVGSATIERHYVPDSNVLQTRFTNHSGSAILTDLMPSSSRASRERILLPDHEILRKITCNTGELEFELNSSPWRTTARGKCRFAILEHWG